MITVLLVIIALPILLPLIAYVGFAVGVLALMTITVPVALLNTLCEKLGLIKPTVKEPKVSDKPSDKKI